MHTPVKLNERVQYLSATLEPFSADVFAVRGDGAWWVYDVGRSDDALAFINGLPRGDGFPVKKNIVISHFHWDHTENLMRARRGEVQLPFDALYLGNYAQRRLKMGEMVKTPLEFTDGMRIRIVPVPNSHAKGSLVLVVGDEYAFLGDSTYAEVGDGDVPDSYNVQQLNEEINLLKSLDVKFFCLSHRRRPVAEKNTIITHLEGIYSHRKKNLNTIPAPAL